MAERTFSKKDASLSYRVLAFTPGDAGLAAYFQLRAQVFRSYGMEYYKDGADAYDKHPDTRFILLENREGELLGGRRILVHEPFSGTRLKTDETILTPLTEMLSHLDTEKLRYAELTSLALSEKARGLGLGAEMYDVTFAFCHKIKADFVVVEAVPTNIRAFVAAATRAGARQITPHPEVRSIDGDEDFRIFASFHAESELPLLSEAQKKAGIGKALTEAEIDALIAYREALKKSRKKP